MNPVDRRVFHAVAEHCSVDPARIIHVGDLWACDVNRSWRCLEIAWPSNSLAGSNR
jgi:predicted HAD superfamily hydrolase